MKLPATRMHLSYLPAMLVLMVIVLGFPTTPIAALSASDGSRHVVVVGGGIGGLAISARIASSSQNYKVTLLEKNSHSMLGGRCGSFDVQVDKIGTFRHERGPSLLLLKSVYEDLFRECSPTGKAADDYGLAMRQCVPAYQVVFDDGDSINLGFPQSVMTENGEGMAGVKEAEAASKAKMDSFEANGSLKWDEYMRATAAYLDCGLPNFIEERLDIASFPAFAIEALRDWGKAWPLKPFSDVLDAFFESDKIRALSSFQALYVGLEPYRNENAAFGGVLTKTAPAVFGLLAAIELHPTNKKAGVFAPVGGFRAVTSAIERLCKECGVRIRYDTTVSKVTESGVYVSRRDDEEANFIGADAIVVNADLPFATKSLLEPGSQPMQDTLPMRFDWDDALEYSSGVVAFHWSTDKTYDDLNTHNVFLAANSRAVAVESWSVLRSNSRNENLEGAPFNFYVHRAAKTDPTAAPEGCDSIMVLVPCETLSRKEEFAKMPREEAIEKYKQQFDRSYLAGIKNEVLRRMSALESLKDVKDHIVNEVIDTPGTYADFYNLAAGTPFALSHGFAQLSLTRPAPQSALKRVFFVGASTRPGNGVPLVLLGAKSIAEKVIHSLKKDK